MSWAPPATAPEVAVSTSSPVTRRAVRRRSQVAVALLVLAAVCVVASGCGGEDDGPEAVATTTSTTVRTATQAELAAVDLTPGLLTADDFPDPDQVEPILLAGDFGAVGAGQRIKLCGEDLRADLGADIGRFSQFRVDRYAVTQTISALPAAQATALGERFTALARECTQPWTQPDPNGGSITREVLGGFPIPDLGTDAAAFLVRGRNDLGQDDAVVLVAVDGSYVSSLTVTGPVGDRFQIVRPLELALGERLRALPQPGGGS